MVRSITDHDVFHRQRRYTQALLNGDDDSSFRLIEEMLLSRCSLGEIYVHLMTPALVAVGELWCKGDIGVGLEKLASHLVLKQIDRLRGIYATDERRLAYRVLISCVEGEQHCIGARMVADLFLTRGWSVDFLGPDLPTPALLETIRIRRPQLVGLSVRTQGGLEHVHRLLEELPKLADIPKILLGGQAIAAGEWTQDGKCLVASDAAKGVEIATRLLHANRPKAVLKEYLVELGRRVRDLRNKKGWTQEQLAESTRLTRVSIVAVEGGKQNVSMDVVIRLANALGIAPEALLSGHGAFSAAEWRRA